MLVVVIETTAPAFTKKSFALDLRSHLCSQVVALQQGRTLSKHSVVGNDEMTSPMAINRDGSPMAMGCQPRRTGPLGQGTRRRAGDNTNELWRIQEEKSEEHQDKVKTLHLHII